MKKKVLIITFSEDNQCISLVQKALEAENTDVYRFDSDLYPIETLLSLTETNQGREMILSTAQGELDLDELDAVWYRRFRVAQKLPEEMETRLREPSMQESRTVLTGLLASFDCFTLDPYYKIRVAANKQLQLNVARKVGIEIPSSLTTNDPGKVRMFYKTCKSGMVAKALSSFAVEKDGVETVMFTTPMTDKDLEDMDGLSLCPMTFQELIPKKVELRITIIGKQIFSAAIDSQASESAQIDWRQDGLGLVKKWENYPLPKEIQSKLLALMDYFGLNYGAIDVIVTPDNRFVFLEINPGGEFFWLELYNPKFPLSNAIANLLLNKAPRR
jgi:MvdD family ATP-grasp ribosomal peptide maturase